MGITTSSRITKITSELSAHVTPLFDEKLDSRSRSKNTFMQHRFTSSVFSLQVLRLMAGLYYKAFISVILVNKFSAPLCAVKLKLCIHGIYFVQTDLYFYPFFPPSTSPAGLWVEAPETER